jgi:hypothetical protein
MTDQGLHATRTLEAPSFMHPFNFPQHERQLLLRTPGISHGVVSRIEREGVLRQGKALCGPLT